MFWKIKWLILWSLWAARFVRQPTVERRLQSGALLRGQVAIDGSHEKYLSIPYAIIPSRFQAPGPEPVWTGTFEAVDEHIKCPQVVGPITIGQENCLVLNVYTPLPAAPAKPLPVMVFIHGGGFKEGIGGQILYGADYLVRHGVILVTLNYRLNVYGFLCLGTKEAPGNAGLKDQLAALKWVQRNIKVFGGDPDNVTLFGESAGGASVSYHMISSASRGLFHKAILQSGSSMSPWARKLNPIETASSLAKVLGYKTNDPNEMYNIFMKQDLFELVATEIPRKPEVLAANKMLPFTPCVETLQNEESFLTQIPSDIYRKGDYNNKVPVITGFTNKEGYFLSSFDDQESLHKIKLEESLPDDLNFTSTSEKLHVAKELLDMYLGGRPISKATILELSELLGDLHFKLPTMLEANYLLESSGKPVYMYIFQYDGWRNVPKFHLGPPFWTAKGAGHADELFYLFNIFVFPLIYETQTISRMTTMWTNFAKYGNPTPVQWEVEWKPTSQENPEVIIIDDGDLRMAPLSSHRPKELGFWKDLFSKYRSTK